MHNLISKETLKIYNSLSKKKEVFMPIIIGHVGLYLCGVTVYKEIHIGNCKTIISLDMIVRYFRYIGYKVRYIRNITDVGHLENESIDKYDKINKKALIERIEPMELAQKYTYDFHNILNKFNVISPNIEPIASGHIIEQLEIIKKLIKKGFAYEIDGSVYFDMYRYRLIHDYGILSRNHSEKTLILKKKKTKKNPLDFALWKQANNTHIMQWMSPWGQGFPGWHIECTAMSTKYLGDVFDIYSGGIDLKFPHHECGIAQSIALHGKIPGNIWLHTNMLTINGEKMSKSIGNIIIPYDILTKFSSDVIRFFILQTHYRSNLSFSKKALISAEKGYNSIIDSFMFLDKLLTKKKYISISTLDIENWKQKCYHAMNDDFNSPLLIAHLFEAKHWIYNIMEEVEYLTFFDLNLLGNSMKNFFSVVLGLTINLNKETSKVKELLKIIMEIRSKAKKEKNWILSDKIRNKLLSLGYILRDNYHESKIEMVE